MSEEFGKAFWEEHYRGHGAAGVGRPNPHLVAEIGDLVPGAALDAGCGVGSEAIWLASRGWRVTAVDVVAAELVRARRHAESLGAGVPNMIDWVQADLTGWEPAVEHFDLVCAHYVHPAGPGEALLHRLAASVAPGGTLFVVGHHPADLGTGSLAHPPEASFTAEQAAAALDPDRWDVVVAEVRNRPAPDHDGHAGQDGHDGHAGHDGHDGHEPTLCDAVLRARKRA